MSAQPRSGGHRRRRLPPASLPRPTVDNTALSFRAVGALLWINSRPDGWVIRAAQMAKDDKRADGTNSEGRPHRREGRDAIRTVLMEELAPEGYYRLERRRMRDGTIEMGTASSDEPVESWAAQHRLFGRNAVPLIEQPDGTFLVQYPDGTLGPDDCDPPEMVLRGDTDGSGGGDVCAGQTGDGKPGPGNLESPDDTGTPGPGNPAPGNPEPDFPGPGFPGPDFPAPLEREVKGLSKEPPSPPSRTGDVGGGSAPATGGEESSPVNLDLARVVAWFARRRPDWDRPSVEDALTGAVDRGMGNLAECAEALRELADGKHGRTDSPRRLYATASGSWWAAVQARRSVAAAAAAAAAPRCKRRGHERQREHDCVLCAAEAKAGGLDDVHDSDPEAADKGEQRFLPASVRQRRSRKEPQQAAAS